MKTLALLLLCQDAAIDKFLKDPKPETVAEAKREVKLSMGARPVPRALFVALARAQSEGWTKATPEFAELTDYFARCAKADHGAAVQYLIAKPSPVKLLLARAHLEEFSRTSVDKFAELAHKMGMTKLDDGRWASPEAEALIRKRDVDSFEGRYRRAITMLREGADISETIKALEALKKFGHAAHLDALAAALKKGLPCKKCKGRGSVECHACKGAGERTVQCNTCEGKGQIYKGVSGRTGKAVYAKCQGCQGKGKWNVDCPTCKKQKIVDCAGCKDEYKRPEYKELFEERSCAFCAGSGFSQSKIVVDVCPFCRGLGVLVVSKSDPSKGLTPEQ